MMILRLNLFGPNFEFSASFLATFNSIQFQNESILQWIVLPLNSWAMANGMLDLHLVSKPTVLTYIMGKGAATPNFFEFVK